MLGTPLLGGQAYDSLRALDSLASRPDVGGGGVLVGEGPHGVIGSQDSRGTVERRQELI
jgi:hypothetical protein